MGIVLPDWVYEAQVTDEERYWNPLLRQIDRRLRLVKPSSRPSAMEMVPNRWHIGLITDDGLELYIPIEGPNGEYMEMSEAALENLRRIDGHSDRSRRANEERLERSRRERAAQKAREREERVTEFAERLSFHENVSIRVPKGV